MLHWVLYIRMQYYYHMRVNVTKEQSFLQFQSFHDGQREWNHMEKPTISCLAISLEQAVCLCGKRQGWKLMLDQVEAKRCAGAEQ